MLCEQLPELEVVKAFNRADVFLKESAQLEFDVCIMDIEMPEMSGLQLAGLLKDKPVIFVTAYKEYAAEAFDLDAVDYVRKPIQKERLQQAVTKAISRLNNKQPGKQFLQLNTDKGKSLIFFDQLVHIKASAVDSRDKTAVLADGKTLTLKNVSFEKLVQQLPSAGFVRINKSELIALKIIQSFSADAVVMKMPASGEVLTRALSEVYRKDFLLRVNE